MKDFHLVYLINKKFSLSSFIIFHIPPEVLFNCVPFFLKKKKTLYLRVTPTSFFFFPLRMELSQIYFN